MRYTSCFMDFVRRSCTVSRGDETLQTRDKCNPVLAMSGDQEWPTRWSRVL